MKASAAAGPEPVLVVPYDPGWPVAFAALREVYARVLGDLAIAIEHVGSTAVPGLAAKPILDVDVVIASREQLPEVVARCAALGYRHEGDLGIPGREAFSADGAQDVPRDGAGRSWPKHHLYVCASDCPALRRHLSFRNWLRAHPEKAAAYGALKLELSRVHRYDRDRYTEGKTRFIEASLESG
jgi:GrpB-like predicted nucleotidyltransferase (UPF0157 family)